MVAFSPGMRVHNRKGSPTTTLAAHEKDCTRKLGRLALWLQEFNIKGIDYIKGEENVVADALSRIKLELITNESTQTSRGIDEVLIKYPNRFKRMDGRVWLIENGSRRLCIEAPGERRAILTKLHDLRGHLG